MKILKNKFLLAIILCVTILSGALCFVAPNKKVNANNDYELKIEKVDVKIKEATTETENLITYVDKDYVLDLDGEGNYQERTDEGYYPQNLQTDNLAMLLNENPIVVEENDNKTYYRQYIKVSFAPNLSESFELQTLSVNATLNDIAIHTKEEIVESGSSKSYCQYFDLTDIKLLTSYGEKYDDATAIDIEEAQGLFKFTFRYMSKNDQGETSDPQTVIASFYALNQSSYINSDDTASIVEPRLVNTESIARENVAKSNSLSDLEKTYPNQYSYFNYNNVKTSDYFGNSSFASDKINYPTITYDPTKYYVSYTKLLYGETETVTSVYEHEDNQVVLTKTSNGTSTTEKYNVKIEGVRRYVEIPLYDIGNYHISFDYVAKQYNTENYEQLKAKNYVGDSIQTDKANMKNIVSETWDVVGDIELSIYGYQLYHTVYKNQNGASESELTDHTALFADVSNVNANAIENSIAGVKFDVDSTGNASYTPETLNHSTVISTNQAPLFFKFNGSILTNGTSKTYSYFNRYDKVGGTCLESNVQIDSSTRFTENGYYEVYVIYTYSGYKYYKNESVENGNTMVKIQTFAFVIENIDPELTLKTIASDNSEEDFVANGFTNKNIKMKWDIGNQFYVTPEITICTQKFDSENSVDVTSTYATQILNGVVTFEESCLYMITVSYGPCIYNNTTKRYEYSASVTYNFTIDKQPISEIEISEIETNDKGQFYVGQALESVATNKNFIVTFGNQKDSIIRNGKKPSGATITATYSQLLFTNDSDYTLIEDAEKIYLQNGFVVKTENRDITYNQITKIATEEKNPYQFIDSNEMNSVLTEGGVYLFNFEDLAGNTKQILVIIDQTSPILLKKDLDDNDNNYEVFDGLNNIVNKDTKVLWGDYKAIKFDSNFNLEISDLLENYESLSSIIKKFNSNYYYYSKISGANVYVNGQNNDIVENSTIFYVDESDQQFVGENIYSITVRDNLGNANDETYLEMNFDKSLLMAHINGSTINNVQIISNNSNFQSQQVVLTNDEIQRLYPDSSTNRQYIYVDWLANEGTEYEIESVLCYFYPLTFDNNSENYPFSASSTQTFDLLANTSYEIINNEQRVASAIVNFVQDERYGSKATMEGMYKIVRKYKSASLPDGSKDTVEREYTFFVDRQNIISYFNNNILIGGGIEINMQNGSKTFSGAQFLQEFVEEYVLTTNKLPVSVNVPTNKYILDLENNTQKPFVKLNYIVKDNWGVEVYNSNKTNLVNNFVLDGTYTVIIYDSNNAGIDKSVYKQGVNQLQFQFSINNSAPVINIAKQIGTNDIIVSEDSFNSKKVKIVWNEDKDGYMANIDTEYLLIEKLLPSGLNQTIYRMSNGYIDKGSAYGNIISKVDDKNWQYEVDLYKFGISEDCKLQITVKYEGDESDYGDNYKTTKTIYFDYTAPEYNYHNLLSEDQFLTQSEKENFEDFNSEVNFENYAFVVDETFKVSSAPYDSFWKNDANNNNINDTLKAWYRKYDKYADENEPSTMQSIVPTDVRYDDRTQAPQRFRFNENLKDNGQNLYTVIANRDASFYDIVNKEPGYYEIIEMDDAGNYRIYTVAIVADDDFDDSMILEYSTITSNDIEISNQIVWESDDNTNYYYNVNSKQMSIKSLGLILKNATVGNNWFEITLNGKNNTTATYRTSPVSLSNYITIEQLIDDINQYIDYGENDFTGYSFGIKFACANGKTFIVNYKTPGQSMDLTFSGSMTNLTVSFTQDPSSSVYLTEFYVYEAINGVVDYNAPLAYDSDSKTIVSNPTVPNVGETAQTHTYTFRNTTGTGRNLVFVYTDNFGVTQKIFKIIGLTDIKYDDMIVINGNYDKQLVSEADGTYLEYYTNAIAKINYQPAIYTISSIECIDENGNRTLLNVNQLTSNTESNGTVLVNLYDRAQPNFYAKYVIILNDTLENEYKFVVNFYSKLADITFVDSSNHYHDVESESTISRALYLNFDKNQYKYPTYVEITKTYTDEYGVNHEETFMIEESIMLLEGYTYSILKYNDFGDQYFYNFTIRKSYSSHFFSVLVKPDGINYQELAPSSSKYNYNGYNIDQYFSIYDAIVEVSGNDNLTYEVVATQQYTEDSYTTVYYIHTNDLANITYQKYIAVTKVSYTKNLVGDNFFINNTGISNQKIGTFTDEVITVTMPAYYQASGNKLQIQIYYNSEYVGTLKDYVLSSDGSALSFQLKYCGTYLIYVSDLAGNNQWFKDAKYYTIYVLNNVVYKLNGEYGVSNSIFNTNVSLSFDETQSLFTRQEVSGSNYKQFIAITATLNGKPYTPTRVSDTYVFSSYGTYIVNLSGILNNDTEHPIVTTVKFSILNQNEAKIAHEYIGLNGYEVVSIKKNSIDITDEIRSKLNMLTLNSFAISGGINSVGGNGHYTITVKVLHDNIVPEQYFSYNVWINNETDALILCSIKEGDSTTKNIEIQLNLYQIYSKIGDCVVRINGNQFITINSTTASTNTVYTYQLTENRRYNVTLETNSGNTLLSFVVTKVEPLNTVAIIVIVVVSLVVIGLSTTFILLRKKMRIR